MFGESIENVCTILYNNVYIYIYTYLLRKPTIYFWVVLSMDWLKEP